MPAIDTDHEYPESKFTLHYSSAIKEPTEYTVFLHMLPASLTYKIKDGESQLALWARVLEELHKLRRSAHARQDREVQHVHAHIYAGKLDDESRVALQKKYAKEFVTWGLSALASDPKANSNAKVKALALYARLTGC